MRPNQTARSPPEPAVHERRSIPLWMTSMSATPLQSAAFAAETEISVGPCFESAPSARADSSHTVGGECSVAVIADGINPVVANGR